MKALWKYTFMAAGSCTFLEMAEKLVYPARPQKEVDFLKLNKVIVAAALFVSGIAMTAHAGVNEFDSCRCGNAIVTRGDTKPEVMEKCGPPASTNSDYGSNDCRQMWLYNFGPNEFMQGICFDSSGRVRKVLSLNHGY